MESLKSIIKYARLPSEYQEVEYIESTGEQYIDTGVLATTLNAVELEQQLTALNTRQEHGCTYYNNSQPQTNSIYVFRSQDNQFSIQAGRGGTDVYFNLYDLEKHTWYFNIATKQCNISDIYRSDCNFSTWASVEDYTFHLFARKAYVNGSLSIQNYCYCKFFKCKIWDTNNILVRDFIPCYRKADGVIGLYDTITGTFYTNAGTGTFSKGADIKYKNSLRTYTASKNLNLLKLTRTEFNQANYQPTDTIDFDYNKIYYMAGSGYMRQYENNDFSETITNRSVEFIQGSSSWWGFGFPIKVKPSMKYTISAKRYDGNKTKLLYTVYNSDGTFSRYGQLTTNVNILDITYTITMGANEDTLIVVVAGITQGDTIYAYDIQVEEGQTATPFIPYGKGAVKSICEKLKDIN